jgi:hypothetical protein
LEEESALLRATQAIAPPPRIPLDFRLTEEELRLRDTRKTLERLTNVVADLVEDETMNSAVDLVANKLKEDEIMLAAANKQKDGDNQSSSSEKDEASEDTLIDMTENVNEEGLFRLNFNAEQNFLKELEERSKFGLLDTLEDTHVAFRTLLGEEDIDGKEDMFIPHSLTVNLAYKFFQRIDPFNVMIKIYEKKQDEMMK